VTLDTCNGSPEWQLSVVHAVQLASPLPAPPDQRVFARRIYVYLESQPLETESDSLDHPRVAVADWAHGSHRTTAMLVGLARRTAGELPTSGDLELTQKHGQGGHLTVRRVQPFVRGGQMRNSGRMEAAQVSDSVRLPPRQDAAN
jgi:hypothetical protein